MQDCDKDLSQYGCLKYNQEIKFSRLARGPAAVGPKPSGRTPNLIQHLVEIPQRVQNAERNLQNPTKECQDLTCLIVATPNQIKRRGSTS